LPTIGELEMDWSWRRGEEGVGAGMRERARRPERGRQGRAGREGVAEDEIHEGV